MSDFMGSCPAPGYEVTGAHINKRTFGAHDGLKWTHGVWLAPDEYYAGCTPLVKDEMDYTKEDGTTGQRVTYRKMAAADRCFDAVVRCDSDQDAANLCRTLRASVIISGRIFEDGLVNLPDGVSIDEIEGRIPAVLSLRKKICSGLGRPTEDQLTAWGQ